MRFTPFFLLTILFIPLMEVSSQWVNNPASNLMICDLSGAQSLPKIVSTSNGGNYISWFDTRSGQYHVYLQRLDPLGYKQWDTNGLLISSNPQSSSLVDYELICDASDNAILIFSDTRNGSDPNMFAYKISPAGAFLWGNNGIDLYNAAVFQANGKAVQTDDGGYVFAWIAAGSPNKVAVQKISAEGNKLWGTNPILLQGSSGEGFNYPSIVKSDNNSVILLHTFTTGSFPAQTVKLRAQKLNSSGVKQWGADGVSIQDLGKIAAFQVPVVISDGMNGAFMSWYDDRDNNNLQSAFVQRIAPDNQLYYPVNGAEASLAAGRQKYNPVVSFDPASGFAYVIWRETEPDQNQNGIMGQKLSLSGERLWGDNAKVFKDLSAPSTTSISNVKTRMGQDKLYVLYFEGNASGMNTRVEAFACNAAGEFIWPGSFATLSNATLEKLHLAVTSDIYNNCKLVWADRRIDEGIYAQDVNPSGQLGNPVTPVELISFNCTVEGQNVKIEWITATEKNNAGFEIQRKSAGSWEVVKYQEGKGTSDIEQHYSYTDIVSAGSYTYRLKQIDYDGSCSYSGEAEVIVAMPEEFSLGQNYPNPFNPSTRIDFSITSDSYITLKVYNLLGEEITSLLKANMNAGTHTIIFEASELRSGVYFYSLNAVGADGSTFNSVRKMILAK